MSTEEPDKLTVHSLKEVVQLIGDAIALVSSPSTLETIFLLHSLGMYKKGFSGFVTNQSAPLSIVFTIPSGTVTIVNP